MNIVKFAIIGAGNIADVHARIINQSDRMKLSAIVSRNASTGNAFAKKYECSYYDSYDKMLQNEDISVVVICTPSTSHAAIAMEAVKYGKHVIIEKPIDVNLQSIDTLIYTAASKGVKICTIYQHRFDEAVMKAKQAIDEGKLGKLFFGACHTKWYRDQNYYKSGAGRGTWASDGGGALMNQSIHYIDLLLYLMGDVSEVYGSCGIFAHTDIEVEDLGVATLKFRNGGLGVIEGTTAAYPGLYTKLDIYGEKGVLSICNDALVRYKVIGMTTEEEDKMLSKVQQKVGASDPMAFSIESHKRQYINFLDSVENMKEPLVNGIEGRKSVEVVQAIYESWRKNIPVRFNY